jgi:uncharacterized protein involved in type VI secretion and phage assembly
VDYNYANNTRYNDSPMSQIEGVNGYMEIARDRSRAFYPKTQIVPTTHAIVNGEDAVRTMNACHARNYSRMCVYEAVGNTPAIRLGGWLIAYVPRSFENIKYSDLGRLRVVEITHVVEGNDQYHNVLKGLVGGTEAMPEDPGVTVPVAYPEVATVKANDDPKHLGRVKVQFIWQDGRNPNDTTNWIRVQSPDAGVSDNVKTNRGFVFIPEVGDQVMVGYEHGDPSRPFVMGSVFHSMSAGGAAENNRLKTMVTRSGHTLEFDDDEKGGWGLTIKDRNGCVFHIDTKGKNIEITAPERITLNANDITLNAGKTLTTTSGEDTTMHVGKNMGLDIGRDSAITIGGSSTGSVGKDVSVSIGGDSVSSVTGDVRREAGNVSATVGGKATVESQDKMTLKSGDEVYIAQ